MPYKLRILCLSCICLLICGCGTTIEPDSASAGTYATQNPSSAIEYAIYMNKQITIFTNQLTTRMGMARNLQTSTYDHEIELTEQSINELEETLNGVIVTMPADTYDDEREATITAMESAIEHMNSYLDDLQAGKDVFSYYQIFQNDFYELTAEASLYNQ